MPLDRHAKRFLDMVAVGAMGAQAERTPLAMRDAMRRLARAVDAKDVPIGSIENRDLAGPGGPLSVRIFVPAAGSEHASAGMVYFHGGMGVFSDFDTHEGLCRLLANASGCRIVSVAYRLAPEHPFPAAVEDSYFAARWVSDHAPDLGIHEGRVVVAGDSAGATLAAVVCQLARQSDGPRIALQLLLCPVTDLSADSESRIALAEGYFIDRSTLDWARELYCPPGADLADARISPLRSVDLSGLPPAHIHTAEYDPMRDEGKAYADALVRAGVDVRYRCHEGMIHNFYCMAGAIPKARRIVEAAGDAIRGHFALDAESAGAAARQRGTKNSV